MHRLVVVFLIAFLAHGATVWLFCTLHDDYLETHIGSLGSSWKYGKIFQRWDGQYYGDIARRGYQGARHKAAFFPLYPAMIATLRRAGVDTALGGVIVSALAFAAAAAIAYALSERVRKGAGPWTVLLLVCSPVLIFYDAVYTESLFLLLALLTLWLSGEFRSAAPGPLDGNPAGIPRPSSSLPDMALAKSGRPSSLVRPPAAALACAFLLCLVRPQGFILAAAIALSAFLAAEGKRRLLALWWCLPVLAAIVVLTSVNMHYGNRPLDWLNAQTGWQRRPSLPWTALLDDVKALLDGVAQNPWHTRQCGVRDDLLRIFDLCAICVGLGFAVWWARLRCFALALFAAAGVLVPLFSGNLLSIGRFTFASPAVVLGLGAWVAARPMPLRVAIPPLSLAVGVYLGLRFTHWCFAG
ncbi:MAG: hypothetical protein HY897_08280 [Deltaproteobacteria bacterium]|nr:hypothetical protein [Deltaproteobacteria bacterium]